MSDIDEPLWHTNDGRAIYVFEMTDVHLKHAKAFLEKRIAEGKYRQPHTCMAVDMSDGPCIDCDDEVEVRMAWEEWVIRFDKEMRRRAADAARRAACPT